jgi:uncharacterized membrane protein
LSWFDLSVFFGLVCWLEVGLALLASCMAVWSLLEVVACMRSWALLGATRLLRRWSLVAVFVCLSSGLICLSEAGWLVWKIAVSCNCRLVWWLGLFGCWLGWFDLC